MEDTLQVICERFARLFMGYSRSYGTFEIPPGQLSGKKKGVARTHNGPLQLQHYAAHLKGKTGIGVIPLMEDNENIVFGAIDIDRYPLDVAALEKDCKELPVVITKSKSGGAHIWLFSANPVPARLLTAVLKKWAAQLGFGKSEVFPKQVQRTTIDDVGNWINLPYFGEERPAFFDGKEQPLAEFLSFAEKRMMNGQTLQAFMDADKDLFSDGPPCLATLANKGIGSGSRNMVLLNVGLYFKKKDPANFLVNLLDFNKNYLAEPLPEAEIHATIAKGLQRKNYHYQCNQEPLCSACNRPACIKREYGVGGADELEVTLTGLSKLDTTPPTWYINIDGIRVEFDDINTLLSQNLFRILVAGNIHKFFKTVKRSVWERTVEELLDCVEVLSAPVEASTKGQIIEQIKLYIQQHAQEDGIDQVAAHTVYINRKENRAYFLSADLIDRLRHRLGSAVSSQKIWAQMKSQASFNPETVSKEVDELGNIRMWSIGITDIQLPSVRKGLSVSKELNKTTDVKDVF